MCPKDGRTLVPAVVTSLLPRNASQPPPPLPWYLDGQLCPATFVRPSSNLRVRDARGVAQLLVDGLGHFFIGLVFLLHLGVVRNTRAWEHAQAQSFIFSLLELRVS